MSEKNTNCVIDTNKHLAMHKLLSKEEEENIIKEINEIVNKVLRDNYLSMGVTGPVGPDRNYDK